MGTPGVNCHYIVWKQLHIKFSAGSIYQNKKTIKLHFTILKMWYIYTNQIFSPSESVKNYLTSWAERKSGKCNVIKYLLKAHLNVPYNGNSSQSSWKIKTLFILKNLLKFGTFSLISFLESTYD